MRRVTESNTKKRSRKRSTEDSLNAGWPCTANSTCYAILYEHDSTLHTQRTTVETHFADYCVIIAYYSHLHWFHLVDGNVIRIFYF